MKNVFASLKKFGSITTIITIVAMAFIGTTCAIYDHVVEARLTYLFIYMMIGMLFASTVAMLFFVVGASIFCIGIATGLVLIIFQGGMTDSYSSAAIIFSVVLIVLNILAISSQSTTTDRLAWIKIVLPGFNKLLDLAIIRPSGLIRRAPLVIRMSPKDVDLQMEGRFTICSSCYSDYEDMEWQFPKALLVPTEKREDVKQAAIRALSDRMGIPESWISVIVTRYQIEPIG